jgi:hypothetical protein
MLPCRRCAAAAAMRAKTREAHKHGYGARRYLMLLMISPPLSFSSDDIFASQPPAIFDAELISPVMMSFHFGYGRLSRHHFRFRHYIISSIDAAAVSMITEFRLRRHGRYDTPNTPIYFLLRC